MIEDAPLSQRQQLSFHSPSDIAVMRFHDNSLSRRSASLVREVCVRYIPLATMHL